MEDDQVYDKYSFGAISLDLDRKKILRDGQILLSSQGRPIRSRRRYELLKALLDAGGAVVSFDDLVERAFDGNHDLELHTVGKTVTDLRLALGNYGDCIQSEYGIGYYFNPPVSRKNMTITLDTATLPEGIDLDTWTRYSVGLQEWNRRTESSLQRGLQHFRQVISRCSTFAPGYIGAGECLALLGHVGFQVLQPSEVIPEARAYARKALAKATDKESRAAAHSLQGKLSLLFDWNFKKAEQEFRAALAEHPTHVPTHHGLAHLFLVTNRWPDSINSIETAQRLAPSSPMIHGTAGWFRYFMRLYEDAAKACRQTTELHPDFPAGYVMLGVAQEELGMYKEAIGAFERSFDLSPSPVPLSALGHAYAKSGKPDKARMVLKQMSGLAQKRFVSSYLFAFIHAGLGETPKALSQLERAEKENCDWLIYSGIDPRWRDLYNEPRFTQLLKRVGVYKYWPHRN